MTRRRTARNGLNSRPPGADAQWQPDSVDAVGEVTEHCAEWRSLRPDHILSFQPTRTSQALTGQAVKKPRIMESCIIIQ